MEQGRR
ncbi:hypothetical protein LINPERPRIM_LOCUS35329 [Linum perenne]